VPFFDGDDGDDGDNSDDEYYWGEEAPVEMGYMEAWMSMVMFEREGRERAELAAWRRVDEVRRDQRRSFAPAGWEGRWFD